MSDVANAPHDTEYVLRRQSEAARDLLETLREHGAENDEEVVAAAIEGETSLLEAVAAALDEIDEAEVLVLGGKVKIEQIQSRVSAEERRIERLRAAIERAMVSTEQSVLRLPTATLSITRRKAAVIVDSEADIPSRFFSQPPAPPPQLDKKMLAEALAVERVPGARLDNGTISLTVRRK